MNSKVNIKNKKILSLRILFSVFLIYFMVNIYNGIQDLLCYNKASNYLHDWYQSNINIHDNDERNYNNEENIYNNEDENISANRSYS